MPFQILEEYNWQRVAVVSSTFNLWMDAAKAIKKTFSNANISIAYMAEYNNQPSPAFMRRTLMKVKLEARGELACLSRTHNYPWLHNVLFGDFIPSLSKVSERGEVKEVFQSFVFSVVVLICPTSERRRFMLTAYDLGMTSGDYVFITMDMTPQEDVISSEDIWMWNDGRDRAARQAFESVFHVSLTCVWLFFFTSAWT